MAGGEGSQRHGDERGGLTLPAIIPETTTPDIIFCEEYAAHGDAVLACVRAGISDPRFTVEVVAGRMLARPEIRASLDALSRARGERPPEVEITRESIVADLQYVYEDAIRNGDRQAAIAAKKLQAGMRGLLIERKQIDVRRRIEEFTTDELLAIAQKGRAVDVEYEEVDGDPS